MSGDIKLGGINGVIFIPTTTL